MSNKKSKKNSLNRPAPRLHKTIGFIE